MLRFVVRQRGTPEAIARGMALGMVVAFSPTIGIQLLMVLLLATMVNANRLSAVVPVFLTNVFTVPVVYGFTYAVGNLMLPGRFRSNEKVRAILWEFTRKVRQQEFSSWHETFTEFFRLGNDLFWPMLVGGLVVGVLGAAISYPVTLWAVHRFRSRRKALLQRRAWQRKARRGEETAVPRPDEEA